MNSMDRRGFLGLLGGTAAGAAALLQRPTGARAAECTSAYVPTQLTVDCASRRNFVTFRENAKYLGLAGVVSMVAVRGKLGSYPAGNLFLFPWLKRDGSVLGLKPLLPTSLTQSRPTNPIPERAPPADEYFCRLVLRAPSSSFIGFEVDVPFDEDRARTIRFTNIDKLADGQAIGINWTSSNLNGPHFGGSRMIPNTSVCNGSGWRNLIADGLNQASQAVCA